MSRVDVKLIGFAPDLDITTQGVIIDGDNFIPTYTGIAAMPSLVSTGLPALSASCRGAAVIRKIDDTRRIFAGSQTKLYEVSSLTWTDVSKSGGSYTGGTESRWRYAQFGNDTIATNRVDPVQVSPGTGAFADLGGSPPKASLIETVAGFVMLADYNDGVNDYQDGVWWSALQNDASWAASIATQAGNNRLLATPGTNRAIKRLGNNVVIYKERSLYLGTYQGPPVLWDFQLIPGEIGAVSQEAVIDALVNNVPVHLFAGFDGFYMFDGSRPIAIMAEVKEWYNRTVSAQYRYRIQARHDPATQLVTFYLPDASGNLTFAIPYNYRTGKCGYLRSITAIEAVLQYLPGGITYDTLGNYYATYADLPTTIAFDSPFWTSGSPVPGIFDNTHTLKTYTGTPGTSVIRCGWSGDTDQFFELERIRTNMNAAPTTGTCRLYYTNEIGSASPSSVSTAGYNAGKFDVMKSAKWFSPELTFTGDFDISAYTLIGEQDSAE